MKNICIHIKIFARSKIFFEENEKDKYTHSNVKYRFENKKNSIHFFS